jgi:hypothetical protein
MVALIAPAVATAQPKPEENNGRISYTADKMRTPVPRERVELASPTPASHGKEFLVVGPEIGKLRRIELEASSGKVDVRRITIAFDDGTTKQFKLDRTVDKNAIAVIDLGGPRQVDQIVVTTDRAPNGKYVVYGVSESSGVASR